VETRFLYRRRRRRYLFGSNSITDNNTNDKIKQISRARLPENPEVNHAGHPNMQFLVYHETTTTILLKNTKKQIEDIYSIQKI